MKKIKLTKKFWVSTAVVTLAVVLTIVGLATWRRPDTYQQALDNIAEARFYLKTAAAENPVGTVHFYSGIRESEYAADGIATPTKPFTILSVEPTNQKVVYNGCITAEIVLDNAAPVTLVLEKNPYGNNYAADLEKAVDAATPVKITFKAGNETIAVTELNNAMPPEAITWSTALEIASKTLAPVLPTDTRLETATKILCDQSTVNTPYWFVSFITENGDRYFVVIDTAGTVVGTSEK